MKIFIDDMRDPPDDSWTLVRKVEPAIKLLSMYPVAIKEISFDHDIENRPDDETFKPIAYFFGTLMQWVKVECGLQGADWQMPKVTIHSINPVGSKEIQDILADYGIESERIPYKADLLRMEKEFGITSLFDGEKHE